MNQCFFCGSVQVHYKMNTNEVSFTVKENVTKTLQNLTIDNKFSPNDFWKLCKKSRWSSTDATSIINTDGVELYGEEMIRNAYSDEFKYRLRKREIIPELKNYELRTEQVCQLRIEEAKKQKEDPYSRNELQIVKKNLKAGKSCGRDLFPPDIFIRGGHQLDSLILAIFTKLKSSDVVPYQWTEVLIATIYKNKGGKKMLINYRGIFLKQILSKMFEKMNMNRISDNIDEIDKFQAGSRPEKGPSDQTFLLRAAIDHSKYIKKPLYLTLYDYSQCFDSLWLSDCLMSLWKLGVKTEALNNIKKLNEMCNFTVKTPVGTTKEANITSIVQQGSVSGGALCSASTGEITGEDLGGGCQIGLSNIKCLTFVDDIAGTNNTIQDTYKSHSSVVWFSTKKRLTLNISKCMVMGINRSCTDVMPRLEINEKLVQCVEVATYLGDPFNEKGSNTDLIDDRIKKGRTCIITATSLCDDVTMGIYAVQTLLLLYRSLFLSVVLYNSQAWSKLVNKEMEKLEAVQLKFIKGIFHCPPSTPNAITFLETGTLPVLQEIHYRQLSFLHHILTRGNDPVKSVYKEQLRFTHERNWANDVEQLRAKYWLNYSDTEISRFTKQRWKSIVKDNITVYTLNHLNNELTQLKHCNVQPYDKLEQQGYLTKLLPQHARVVFQLRTGVLDIKTCRKYRYNDTTCRLCGQGDEDVEHVINKCPLISRTSNIENYYNNDNIDKLKEVASRFIEFEKKTQ